MLSIDGGVSDYFNLHRPSRYFKIHKMQENEKKRVATQRLSQFAFTRKTPGMFRQMARRGLKDVNLISEWDKIVGPILAKYSIPEGVKNISGRRILIIKVFETRIIEFQHQKADIQSRVNLTAGYAFIEDIKFTRTRKIPKSKYERRGAIKSLPETPHPSLTEQKSHFQNKNLEKAIHKLAHCVLAVPDENDKVKQEKTEPQRPQKAWLQEAKKIL
ncbi:MAG: DUF721 domain-containing protein [Pseudomonadota bacterium]